MLDCVFVPYSARGHVNPMLAVAAELAASGSSVRMVVGERFADEVAESDVRPVSTPRSHEVWSPPSWGPRDLARLARVRAGRRAALHLAAATCRDEFRRVRPDLVVADVAFPGAARAAASAGVPVVWCATNHVVPRRPGPVLVNGLPELHGMSHRPRCTFVGPLLRPEPRRAVLAGGAPLLLVSPGTVFARTPAFFRQVAREFAGTDWTVLIATGHTDPAALGPLPGNVLARRRLPQREVLRSATAFLTHGGMNSVHEALHAGVPMLLAPRNREQRGTARRLVGLGLGVPAAGGLRRCAERLVGDPRVRAATERMRSRLADRDGPRSAVRALLRSAGRAHS